MMADGEISIVRTMTCDAKSFILFFIRLDLIQFGISLGLFH